MGRQCQMYKARAELRTRNNKGIYIYIYKTGSKRGIAELRTDGTRGIAVLWADHLKGILLRTDSTEK